MTDHTAKKLYDLNQKILKWACKAEDASTCSQKLRALRKIAKFSLKLAKAQGRAYTEATQEEPTNEQL